MKTTLAEPPPPRRRPGQPAIRQRPDDAITTSSDETATDPDDPAPASEHGEFVRLPPDVRAVLARRDIPALYRALQLAGVSQRTIGERTGQLQSEVSDIIAGRQVTTVRLLERIVDGLGIPRQLVGLTTTPSADSDTSAVPTTVERRASSSLRRRVPPITRDIDPADAANVPLWTARDVWALRHALRHTVAEFARHLDVSNQMIKKWETGSTPRAFYQSLLDAALARADSTTQARFTRLASSNPGTEYARP